MRQTSPRVHIVEYEGVKVSKPNVIVGLPEAGLVGSIAATYLSQKLALPEIGYVDSELEAPVIVVEKSIPRYTFRIFGRDDLVLFSCEIPLTPRLATEFSNTLVDWCFSKQARLIIGTTGLPSSDRLEQANELPDVFYTATAKKEDIATVLPYVHTLEEAVVIGTYALILKKCMTRGQPNITFFAESHRDFPDPGAAAAVINVLKPLTGISVDIKPLLEESEEIRLKTRELMKRTQQSMEQMTQGTPGVYA